MQEPGDEPRARFLPDSSPPGDTSSPPGDTSSPSPPGDTSSPPGDSSSPSPPGDTSSPPGDSSSPSPPGDRQVSARPRVPSAPPLPSRPPAPPGLPGPPVPATPAHLRRQRQERTVYNKEQQRQLEKQFQKNKYPTYADRSALAEKLRLNEYQVQVWFKNRRAKASRQQLQQLQQLQQPVQPLHGLHGSRALAASGCSGPPGQVPAAACCYSVFRATPGFRGLALPSASCVFSAVNSAFSSCCQASAGPEWDAQDDPGAAAAAWPRAPQAPDIKPNTALFSYFPKLLSPRVPFEEPLAPATPAHPLGDGIVDKDTPGPARY